MEIYINFLGVLIATIVAMIIGMTWYSDLLFGKTWKRLSGFTKKKLKEMQTTPIQATLMGFLITFAMFATVDILFNLLFYMTIVPKILVGVLLWFITSIFLFHQVIWENKNINLYLLSIGNNFLTIVIGVILLSVV